LPAELKTASAASGEARVDLPGSKSVAREERTVRNQGDPVISRRTNYEDQAGRNAQRQEGRAEGKPGVGSLHSSARQPQGIGAEEREGGDRTTQPVQATSAVGTTGQSWPTFLRAIADKARKDPNHRFGDLYRHLNEESLRASFYLLRKAAASGVDGVTFRQYERNLEDNLANLVERLKRKSYHARLVRRKYIPKGNGKLRPLGIPTLEDKLLQCAVTQILMAIYEADFLLCSYAYRPQRGPHDAVRELTDELHWGKHNFVVEADIKGFFDHLQHDPLMEMLGRRIQDGALLRLIRKWLKAGILEEDGRVIHPELGTPQGGVISPVLANVYLHYVLDLWCEKVYLKSCTVKAKLIGYDDDIVVRFRNREDATRFPAALAERLAKFGLEVEPTKTKVLEFGRDAARQARARGERPGTFDFLGFTHYCSRTKDGKRFRMKRVTSRKKFRAKVVNLKESLKQMRVMPTRWILEQVGRKLRGHYAYYGVSDNHRGLVRFYREATKLLYKWLNRRSQRRSYQWAEFKQLLQRFPLPLPCVRVHLFYRSPNDCLGSRVR